MLTKFYKKQDIKFEDHPKFAGVKIAKLVNGIDGFGMGVSMLHIGPSVEIPVHTHNPQIDSIYVTDGKGEAFINGAWRNIETGDYIIVPAEAEHGVRNTGNDMLRLFIVHNPALF